MAAFFFFFFLAGSSAGAAAPSAQQKLYWIWVSSQLSLGFNQNSLLVSTKRPCTSLTTLKISRCLHVAVFFAFDGCNAQWEESRLQNSKGLTTVEHSSHLAGWSLSMISQPEQKGHAKYACSLQGDTWVYTTRSTMRADFTLRWRWQGTPCTVTDLSQYPQHCSSSCSFWTSSLWHQPHPSPCHQPCQLPLGLQSLPAQQITMQNRPNSSQNPINLQLGSATRCCVGNYTVTHIHSTVGPKDGTLPLIMVSTGSHLTAQSHTFTVWMPPRMVHCHSYWFQVEFICLLLSLCWQVLDSTDVVQDANSKVTTAECMAWQSAKTCVPWLH